MHASQRTPLRTQPHVASRRVASRIALGLALLAAAGCSRQPPAAPTLVAQTPPAVVAPVIAARTTAVTAAPPPAADVDLLRATEAEVAVSSVVANPTDRADNLVDGNLATVWSSATGQLSRTWIVVRLPPDAQVRAIEMTAGYTRGAADAAGRDLFTANVRIARVRVTRDGALVGEFPLDPNSRALQRVPAQGAGGEWLLETVGLVPGTERAWREVSVSELRVLGVPGAAGRRANPAPPRVDVDGDPPMSISAALREARHNLLGEGVDVRREDYGCSGASATSCGRRMWLSVADAGLAIAEARCGSDAFAPYREHYHALRRLHAQQGRLMEANGDYESVDAPADDALEHVLDDARAIFASCPQEPRLRGLGEVLGDLDALRGFHWRQSERLVSEF